MHNGDATAPGISIDGICTNPAAVANQVDILAAEAAADCAAALAMPDGDDRSQDVAGLYWLKLFG